MSEVIELDLSMFGYMEIESISSLLHLFCENKVTRRVDKFFDFSDGLKIGYNTSSTTAFFYNDDLLTIVESEGKLQLFMTCSECGMEGDESEFVQYHNEDCEGCQEVIKNYELE